MYNNQKHLTVSPYYKLVQALVSSDYRQFINLVQKGNRRPSSDPLSIPGFVLSQPF